MTPPPSPMTASRTGGQILADQLRLHGADRVFCVAGESFLAFLDGLYTHRNQIGVVWTRHESGASNMADAYGKLTGKPGICAVTRGPGATNAANGIHTAFQDSTPLILLIGQVPTRHLDREAFQEMDYRRMFGQMAKWVAEIESVERIPEYIARAFHVATAGRPGPVVLSLPEDILSESCAVADAKPYAPALSGIGPEGLEDFAIRLENAEKPFLILGGTTWTPKAVRQMTEFAERNGIPTGCSFRAQDRMDNRHPNYAGHVGIGINPKLAQRVRESDLLIVAGARLGDMTTQGYSLLPAPTLDQELIHIHPGADELGHVYAPNLAIAAAMPALANALSLLHVKDVEKLRDWRESARADYLEHIAPTDMPGDVNLGQIVKYLSDTLPDDAMISNGAGNYAIWLHRHFQYKAFPTQLAPTSGSMGYGLPAAIAGKLTHPDRIVVNFSGDGCFMMLPQELATARQFGANTISIVVNNGILGTIRMHQERHFPGRVMATDLKNPDFVAMAKSFGCHGELVTETAAFPAAFDRALEAGRPALIELRTDPRVLSPTMTLED